ncbi:DUF4259 domain-containing protein [Amycolatopsis sp. NEAU-NG30]|uniref:DUF4259 domain-containing protein n=1 Tax=Amycolatopsis melonis TaxID=3156488 RepID=A0ABV0LEX8_9PSEU
MGTWGDGPFGSDAAQDLLEQLEESTLADRRAELMRILGAAVNRIDGEEVLPDEILAGVAVVVANLPAGAELPWNEEVSGLVDWLPEADAGQLRDSALEALETAFSPGNQWWESWVDQGDRARMQSVIDRMRVVLDAAGR